MTHIDAITDGLNALDAKITGLIDRGVRAATCIADIRHVTQSSMDAGLKLRSINVLIDGFLRDMEPEPEDDTLRCETCDTPITRDDLRYEEGGGTSEPRWTDTGCVYCLKGRNVKPVSHDGAQSQAERDGDA